MRSSEKQSRHFYLMRRHSRAGGNPDLFFRDIQRLPQYGLYPQIWFAEISVAAGLYIFSRAKPTLRMPIADTRKSSEKNSSHIPASRAVIPAQAGIQTFDFQKYSAITAVWALPTDAVCRNIGLDRAFMFYRRNPPYFQTTFLVKSNVQK